MKKYFILSLSFLTFYSLNAQQNWLKSYGSQTIEEVLDATSTPNGDIITAGYFTGVVTFGANTLISNGNSDILVVKTNGTGDIIWATHAGGIGADRVNSITSDANGNSYITGFFYNSATFDAITVTGQNRDAFVAKIDANGNFLWAVAMGGQFGDTGYGIEVDNLGNIFCTGQYKGNGVFGSTNFVSMTDPTSNQPSYDIFITKLDANGNFLWTKDGKAKYDDRGLAITVDNNGNCYLAAEFSDTIAFTNTYNNSAFNVGIILKFDANGNEHWSTIARAGQVLLNDIKWKNNKLYLTGDYRGNLTVEDVNNTETFLSQHNYNIFTTQFSDLGDLIWLSSNFSDNEIYAKELVIDNNNDIYITGMFKCDFTEMNQTYGNSTFLSIGYRDIHYMKYDNLGQFKWARQVGSNKDDYCASIIINDANFPIIAGSYENTFNVPSGNNFISIPNQLSTQTPSIVNCPNGMFGPIVFENALGYKDIFLTSPFDINRLPYDYYTHINTSCSTDTLPPCIEQCQDTIEFCYDPIGYNIDVNHFQYWGSMHKPLYNYQWNLGSTTNSQGFNQNPNTTQQISVNIERQDGCYAWQDTIVVSVNPLPDYPEITDTWGYNTYQPPLTNDIDTCSTDSLFLFATTNDTNTVSIIWNSGIVQNDSTIYVPGSGFYAATATNIYGCVVSNSIEIIQDDFAIHDTLNPYIIFNDSILNTTDSILICESEEIYVHLIDSAFTIPSGLIPYKYTFWSLDGVQIDSVDHGLSNTNGEIFFSINTSGWHNIAAHLVNECGDTVDYFMDRNFYVDLIPTPYLSLSATDLNVCIGDTVMIYANTFISQINWVGSNILNNYTDSIQVQALDYYNSYNASVDTIVNGKTCSAESIIIINTPSQPQISIFPTNGVVCPGDSVLLTALSGVGWQWIAPNGNFLGTNQTQYVNLPGYYHCIVTLASGCILTSNFVETKEYSSPFLVVNPGVICPNQSAEIEVFSPIGTVVNWLNPLSGSSNIQIVDSAGVYYCETSYCGITKIDSVTVTESNPIVNLNFSTDTIICPIDIVNIIASPGFVTYQWNNGSNYNNISTSDSGQYYVQVENLFGCIAHSDTITISYLSNPIQPTVTDTAVCLGNNLLLTANAPNTINWYQNGQLINTGPTYTINNIQNAQSFSITNSDAFCTTNATTLNVTINQSSIAPVIIGDSVLCEGENLQLVTDSTYNQLTYNWTTPNGTTTNNSIIVTNISLQNSGIYSLYFSDSLCSSDTTEFSVTINPLPIVNLNFSGDTSICPMDSVLIQALTNADTILWSNQLTDSSFITNQIGSYNYVGYLNGCFAMSDTIIINYQPYTQFNGNLTSTICQNDSLNYSFDSNYTIIWLTSSMDSITTSNNFNTGLLTDTTQYNLIVSDSTLCPIATTVTVNVIPSDFIPNINLNTNYCLNDSIQINALLNIFDSYTWLNNGEIISTDYALNFPSDSAGNFSIDLIVNIENCPSDTANINFEINTNPTINLPLDTIFCLNQTLNIETDFNVDYIWLNTNLSNYDSLVIVTITDTNGCVVVDSLNVSYINCTVSSPNVFTPNGDNINDVYYFEVPNGEILSLTIYNRWGGVIYYSPVGEWLGRNNNDIDVSDGTYFYILEYKTFNNETKNKEGYLQLIR